MRSPRPTSRRTSARCALATIAAAVLACVPIPHTQREAPAIDGVVLRRGLPAAGVRVRLAVNQRDARSCDGARQEVVTDAQGRFQFRETSYFTPAFVYGDRFDAWTVCFAFPDALRAHWHGSGMWGGPRRVRLDCRVDSAPDASASLPLDEGASPSPDLCVATEPLAAAR
jgi:hypothetical protein